MEEKKIHLSRLAECYIGIINIFRNFHKSVKSRSFATRMTHIGITCLMIMLVNVASMTISRQIKSLSINSSNAMYLMQFNIRNAHLDDKLWRSNVYPHNSWNERRPLLNDVLMKYKPFIIGMQEGTVQQLDEIMFDLNSKLKNDINYNYASITQGRQPSMIDNLGRSNEYDNIHNEHMSIIWNQNVLKIIDYGSFALSDTPNKIPSRFDDNIIKTKWNRLAIWGLFTLSHNFNNNNKHCDMLFISTQLNKGSIDEFNVILSFVKEYSKQYKKITNEMIENSNNNNNNELLIYIVGDFNSVQFSKESQLYMKLKNNELLPIQDCISNYHLGRTDDYFGFPELKIASNEQQHLIGRQPIDWILCNTNVVQSYFRIENAVSEIHSQNRTVASDHAAIVLEMYLI